MNKKKYLDKIIDFKEEEIFDLKLKERYFQRRMLEGGHKEAFEKIIGDQQRMIEEGNKYLEFLKEVAKENE